MTSLKFVKGSKDLVEGLAIPFGGPFGGKDFDGEFFTKNTDFCLDWFPDGRPLLYHHGLDGAIQTAKIGTVKSTDLKDDGMWIRAQLDKASAYREAVGLLVDEEALGLSSGTMPHLVRSDVKTGEITRWPWVEESVTPTPSNPDAVLYAVKSTDLLDHLTAIEAAVPAALVAVAMKALDRDHDDDALPDGVKFADLFDRLLADGEARVQARKDWHGKSGRVLPAATRARLAAHPEQLRTLAQNLEELLLEASGEKFADPAQVESLMLEARLNGVVFG